MYDNWKATNDADEFLGSEPTTTVAGSRLLLEPVGLAETLDAVPRRHLNLSVDGKRGCHRPDLSIRPSTDEDQPPAVVSITVGAMFGQPMRWIEMSPGEARTLARHLIETADLIDRETETVS